MSDFCVSENSRSHSAWPDWAIFERSWLQIIFEKLPKYLVTFGAILTNGTFQFKTSVDSFWTNIEKLGYFNFQHLVTLINAKFHLIVRSASTIGVL